MEFRHITDQDYKHIQRLYRRCFNYRITLSEIKRKYKRGIIGYLAMDNSNPAAFYGVFRHDITFIRACQSADTMTDPDYRGEGLFTKLARMTYLEAQKQGIQLIFGFPNENSYPGFIKLGWQFNGYLNQYHKRAFPLPVAELLCKSWIFRYLYRLKLPTGFKYKVNGHLYSDKPARWLAFIYLCGKAVHTKHEQEKAGKVSTPVGYLFLDRRLLDGIGLEYNFNQSDTDMFYC